MTDLTPILNAVRQASVLCHRVQQTHYVRSEKAADDPVTIADYGVQAIICRALREYFPDDGIIAEERGSQFLELVNEAGRAQIVRFIADVLGENVTQPEVVTWLDHGHDVTSERTWVIDPIDGTKGFIAMRRYSIAVGILKNGQPDEGILGSPGRTDADPHGMIFYTRDSAVLVACWRWCAAAGSRVRAP
jgi:3'(2'), 5'-bisphosphate nucleotidase